MDPNVATKRKQTAEPQNGSDSINAAKRVKISATANASTKRKKAFDPHDGSEAKHAAKRVRISTNADAPAKRKQAFEPHNGSEIKHAAKRVKTIDARTILAQSSDKALNKNGDLDVSTFVKARDYEIKAIEATMSKAKDVLSTRAFQQVPRDLRRRTASHNVKRVPKRLRARAAKEVCHSDRPVPLIRECGSADEACKSKDEGR